MDIDHKGLNQLLLSPLYLFDQVLGTVIPGGLFMLLLCLKGNALLRTLWNESPLGYKTKIAAFILLAYVVGHVVKLPLSLIVSFRKKEDISGLPDSWKKQTPEVRKILKGMVIDGALLSTPGLIDHLSVVKAEAGFHVGTGTALLLAALVPGDGSLRWLEALIGLVMFWVGISKGLEYAGRVLETVGVGLANVFAKMNPQQLQLTAALFKSLDLFPPDVPPPTQAPLPKVDSPAGSGAVFPPVA